MSIRSRLVCLMTGITIGCLGTTPRADAVWVDDFNNNDPLTNSTTTGWAVGINQGSTPITAEPGRDGLGTLELASHDGNKRTLSTAAALDDLGFFTKSVRLVIEDWNSWVYQYTPGNPNDRTLGGGTSNALTHFFVSGFGGAGNSTPRDNAVNDGLKITHHNGNTLTISQFLNGPAVGDAPKSIAGVAFNGTNYDIVLDLDAANYVLSVYLSSDDSLVGSVNGAHGLSLSGWSTGGDKSFLVFETQSGSSSRYTTLSVGKVSIGPVPEPATMGLLAAGGLALQVRRRRLRS